MNNLILLSENSEFSYYAVQVPMDASKAKIITFFEDMSLDFIANGFRDQIEIGEFEVKPELLGVYGEIPDSVANEIMGLAEDGWKEGYLWGKPVRIPSNGAFEIRVRLEGSGIDLTKNKVAIIKTKK
jgi:hypothetical protein